MKMGKDQFGERAETPRKEGDDGGEAGEAGTLFVEQRIGLCAF